MDDITLSIRILDHMWFESIFRISIKFPKMYSTDDYRTKQKGWTRYLEVSLISWKPLFFLSKPLISVANPMFIKTKICYLTHKD